MKPTEEFLQACLVLSQKSPQYKDIVTYLELRRVDIALKSCNIIDDVQVRWAGGRAQELAEILTYMKNPKEALEALRNKR